MKSGIILTPLMGLLEENVIEFKNVIEFGALLDGRKQVIRLVIPAGVINGVGSLLKQAYPHIELRKSSFFLQDAFQTNSFDRFQTRVPKASASNAERVMFIGEKHAVDEAREIEEADCSDSDTSRRYGYPRCCGIAYGQYAIAMEGGWIEHYLSHLHGHDYMSFTANRIASLVQPWLGYHYDYFPCQPGCKESNEINEKNRSMLIKSDLAEFIELVDRHLNAAVVYHDGCIWYVHKEQFRSGNEYVCSPGLTAAVKNSHDAVRLLSRIHIHQNSVDVVIDGLLLSTADTSGLKVIIYE